MNSTVKQEGASPADLRALCAVHHVRYGEIARRLGRSLSWLSLVLNEKRNIEARGLAEIGQGIQAIIEEQGSAGRTPRCHSGRIGDGKSGGQQKVG
jgi:hypothetical protein